MGKINVGRLLLSALIIGVLINIGEAIVNGWLFGQQWSDALVARGLPPLGLSQILIFNVFGLVVGLAAAWIYAAARPRFGAGQRTAAYAGLVTWVLAYALSYATLAVLGLMPVGLMVTVSATNLLEVVLATVIGCYFYKETA